MSHPNNRRERFLVGKRKSYNRVFLFYCCDLHTKDELREMIERNSRHHRDTTKICSAVRCCGNPRKRGELTMQELRFFESCNMK
jgi:putative IMPACT (imprinted ancient) family translation regulator